MFAQWGLGPSLLALSCTSLAMPKTLASAGDIIKDVEDFIKEHGRRPSRGVALGKIVHVKLKSTSTSAEEKKALQTAMASAPIGHAATTSRLKTLKSKLIRGGAVAGKERRFCHNQACSRNKDNASRAILCCYPFDVVHHAVQPTFFGARREV